MPEFPKNEEEVREAFMDIVQKLKTHWSGGDNQDVIDTHKNRVTGSRDASSLRPDIFFTGCVTPSGQSPHWSSCIVAAEAKTKKARSGPDTFGQLGSYAEQIFSAQENRRFIPSFFVDEWNIRFFIFDRGGAISGQLIEYHTDPWKLYALVQNFLFSQGPDTGFDESVFYHDYLSYILTTVDPEENADGQVPISACISDTRYIVEKTLFHCTNIRGNGTIYWLVKEDAQDSDARYLIKDSWVVGGCAREQELLQRCKGIDGVAPLFHIHNVMFKGELDSVSKNRPPGAKTDPLDDRVHTRTVLCVSKGAKLLHRFSTTIELLEAFRDAVEGVLSHFIICHI